MPERKFPKRRESIQGAIPYRLFPQASCLLTDAALQGPNNLPILFFPSLNLMANFG